MKWGEYSSDVQFILQRSDQQKLDNALVSAKPTPFDQQKTQMDQKSSQLIGSAITPPRTGNIYQQNNGNTNANINNLTNNLTSNTNTIERKQDLVGIVKGIPKQSANQIPKSPPSPTASSSSSTTTSLPKSPVESPQKDAIIEFNSADVRSSLDRKTNGLRDILNLSNESLDRNGNSSSSNNSSSSPGDLFKNCPPISSNGALAPPPYRNPPPPRSSPPTIGHQGPNSLGYVHQKSDSLSSNNSGGGNSSSYRQQRSNKFDFLKEMTPPLSANGSVGGGDAGSEAINEHLLQTAQYRDLMQLIQFQRDKISSQQADITKVCIFP